MERSSESVNQPSRLANAREIIAIASLVGRHDRTIESTMVGQSMGQSLPAGSRVRIRLGAPAAVGAVGVVAVDGILFAHRVVGQCRGRRGRSYVITRGDRTVLCDAPVQADCVIGIVEQCDAGSGWRPVSGEVIRSSVRSWMAAGHRGVMLGALAAHVALANAFSIVSFGLARVVDRLTLLHRRGITPTDLPRKPSDPI